LVLQAASIQLLAIEVHLLEYTQKRGFNLAVEDGSILDHKYCQRSKTPQEKGKSNTEGEVLKVT
jgi:hypothetical protein